jgi:hypothetical protein
MTKKCEFRKIFPKETWREGMMYSKLEVVCTSKKWGIEHGIL